MKPTSSLSGEIIAVTAKALLSVGPMHIMGLMIKTFPGPYVIGSFGLITQGLQCAVEKVFELEAMAA